MTTASELLDQLKTMVEHYVKLAGCGDCGFWDPEEEAEVIAARAVIAKATQGIDAGTGETRQGLDAKHESPVGEADAPEDDRGEVLTGYGEE